ncbi:UDP-Glycosyltransferase/glycogen phosphorylase [Terfezia boudieri ATCC MYA-4762]|uniref:Sterol 3-beta-glucosyltransferase n=1 Tax=Terfezia boudieri ATCC MYA-4762 TaxID=1051890 RepID=A0A3N4LRK4_9PEZI|nr:UDP-Glycosyltransferase/glycogen phosphorylase [Terfezia boudieri ATCC MYA-4762]
MPSNVDNSRANRSFSHLSPTKGLSEKPINNEDDSQKDAAEIGGSPAFNMNQSIFQMITAAGSKANLNKQYESSDSEDIDHDDSHGVPHNVLRSVAMLKKPTKSRGRDMRMLQSTPHLLLRTRLETFAEQDGDIDDGEDKTAGPSSPNRIQTSAETAALQPDLLSAALGASMANNEAEAMINEEDEKEAEAGLATKLMEIFGFSEPEEVISEYPCWLLKSVLLQGYMYITTRHVCFYAYLPKKSNTVIKSGSLSKRGKNNPKYHRYWFVLKGDVLSYYENPGDLYFPSGTIDLRYGVQASVHELDKGKDYSTFFDITTTDRVLHFKADSVPSAKEWVKALNKIIFRSHNDGDGVKIVLPIGNIFGLEESPVLEFADTFRVDVLDQVDHTTDEYFFSFFSFGKEALKLLKSLTGESAAHGLRQSRATIKRNSPPVLLEQAKTTLKCNSRSTSPIASEANSASPRYIANPFKSPRVSGEHSRSSLEIRRRSTDISRSSSGAADSQKKRSARPLSGDSFADSLSQDISFGGSDISVTSEDETGSQILSGSKIFQKPTLTKLQHNSLDEKRKKETLVKTSVTKAKSGLKTCPSDSSDKRPDTPSSIANIARAGQRAAEWAEWMKRRSKEVASRPIGYIERVSDMWSGGKKHYGQPLGAMPDEQVEDGEDDDGTIGAEERYREKFALQPSERLLAAYYGYLNRVIPLYGKIYLGDRHLCYRSLVPGTTRTKMILPLKDIENVSGEGGFKLGYSGLVITIRGHEELFFEFGYQNARDDCWMHLLRAVEAAKMQGSTILLAREVVEAEVAKREYQVLQDARHTGHADHNLQLPTSATDSMSSEVPPILFDDPQTSFITFKPTESLRITCLTIGSRGDVQPYIALCKGLLKEGHRPRIATHAEFQPWVESHGIEFARVEGDPAELIRICVENGMFTYSFLREASSKFRGWIDELLISAWVACQDSDLLIESPSAMAGIHIAEALQIPYFRAFTMPWTRTRAYPHAFAVPERKMGGPYNYFTYVMFDNVFWKAIAGQVNRWRKKTLNLPRTNLDKLQPNKVPFLYNFSPSVVVPPIDFSDWIRVTGYWFLEEQSTWKPPNELVEFIRRARVDGKKLVYVGFGSIVVSDPTALTSTVVESVVKADVRCILSKGWSDRKNQTEVEIPMPPEIHQIKSAPHDWLFSQIDAATHHGGAGTTGASLRAGIPTIIKPFFGDQFFFASRVQDLGVGIYIKKLNVSTFSKALRDATHDGRMVAKARVLGESIRKENGVETAIQAIYRDMEYAKSLMKRPGHEAEESGFEDNHEEDWSDSWTIVGDETEAEAIRRYSDSFDF